MNDSWYRASVPAVPPRAQLQGVLDADVCIVGAGFTGLSAALELAEAGRSVIVLEAEDVGWGCSGRNGGQINPGVACDHARVVSELGEQDARRVWQLGLDGVDLLRDRVERYGIDCDLKWGILLVANKARQVPELRAWQQELGELGYDRLEFHDRAALQGLLNADYQAGVMDLGGGDLHPLKYVQGLARAAEQAGVRIFERSAVRSYREQRGQVQVCTAGGQVRAGHLLLAGNAYLGKLLPWYRKGFMPIGSYIGATRPLGDLAEQLIPSRAAVCDMNTLIDYYRLTPDNRLLFGGRASARDARPDALRQTMRERMAQVFGQLAGEDFEYLWGGQVAMTMSKAPVFGRLGPRVLFTQGYSGQGVALAGLAGKLMAETVLGDARNFDLMARWRHLPVPPGAPLQTAIRALALLWYRLQDSR
ncbi:MULTISPECIES: NAD(P)/FAD-dependent oxidoreductase [Halopseudomonas]|jgi:gamma-glutamylputrescine oxidase|uniref:NAD(P)/FAD-dependent oxidoreductase n=1 Tax=Halopseudomonas TaxID=2901189 RepID=UPI000C409A91|nr:MULTISPECIES: FAD-binding oxidoreductase [Halopseudomonas]MAK73793.1 FAD-dependent oxidoreductase [Pseudomonadales bacterium]HBT55633.1 FAD-dependent oxidoreductase [Pseudomonas sp.]MAP77046.1 FAD-dependent oxidoreductase [Pseudomonadales bacterium]MAY08712.1 FAD-dependent oxidoreductase [Pseudomonadales bacterium]BDX17913.1 oxidoreductase [Halopseudomonas aestusnigri]|tara:strand:+ start:2011 stop:3270 length:1260 start_codon:yes stop_codon:yes gene_type:complete